MPVTGLTGVTAISAGGGGNFACALLMGGTVECWGDNQYGELGNGSTATNSWTPVAVSGLTGVTAISAGNYDACALLMGGTVKCWGDNEYGELDDGPATGPEMCSGYPCSSTPVAISGLTGVTAISAGGGSSICVLLSGGTVKCWGDNYGGELGNGSTGPETCEGEPCATAAAVSGLTGVSAISEGDYSACALLSGGTVKCWGDAGDGELGNGSSTAAGTCGSGACSTTPVATSLTGVTAVSVGVRSACALLTNGTVECWGWNEYGQLGDGTRTGPGTCSGDPCSTTPVAVTGLTGVTAISESSDGEGVCALLSGGTVECWGLAAESMSSTPVAVTGL
jgi:alpha-tubulin suppressor-like RCC1 family protein